MPSSRLPLGPEYAPAFDATMHPASAETQGAAYVRAQEAAALHTWYGSSAAALAFSHYRDPQPSRLAVEVMGLAAQRDLIERAVSRNNELPYPGVDLPVIPFQRSPSMEPIVGGFDHLRFHAHDKTLVGTRGKRSA